MKPRTLGEASERLPFVRWLREGDDRRARRLLRAAALLVVLAVPPAVAADDPAPVSWSVREAVSFALQNNPEVAVAHNRIEELRQQRGVVFSSYLPDVSFEASYWYLDNVPLIDITFNLPSTGPGAPAATFTKEVTVGANNNALLALKFNQLLFASGRVYYADRSMKGQVAAGEDQEDSIKLGVARQTAEVYDRVLILAKVVEVQRAAQDAARAHCEQVRHRFDAGAATQLELLRSQVEASNLEAGVTQAEKNYESALVLLKRIKGGRGSFLAGAPEEVYPEETGAPFRAVHGEGYEAGEVLEAVLASDGAVLTRFVPVRPVPNDDNWFERDWADFRTGLIFKQDTGPSSSHGG